MQQNQCLLLNVSVARPVAVLKLWISGLALATTVMISPMAHAAAAQDSAVPNGIKAFKLCTGPDNVSHVVEGTLDQKVVTEVGAVHFKETPAHSAYDWHPAPEEQYVISLTGTLKFLTTGGETFVLSPGDVLLAQDTAGPGHRWEMIGDQPWRRAYIVLKPGVKNAFVAKSGSPDKGC